MQRGDPLAIAVFLCVLLAAAPASAQVDFTGAWGQRFHEDAIERGPGPDVGDFLGLPINDAARLRAESWQASQYTQPEWACRQHQTGEIIRAPQSVTMWKEINLVTRETVAWHAQWARTNEASNVIYMDGRPHPPEDALHTFMGFSTGTMVGDVLVVTTTHLKEGFIRRNGVPRSDQQTVVQHYMRRGNYLTIVSFVYDPVYLTEPMVQSSEYVLTPGLETAPWPCFEAQEIVRPRADVPHNLPGTDNSSAEFAKKTGLPLEAVKGGAETVYPAYQRKLGGAR